MNLGMITSDYAVEGIRVMKKYYHIWKMKKNYIVMEVETSYLNYLF